MTTNVSLKTRSMNARIDPAGKAWGLRRASSGSHLWIAVMHTCLCLALLVMAWVGIYCCRPAQGAELSPDQPQVPSGPLSYDDAVRLAIRQSPYFTKSSIEIDIRRLDETDSRYGMVPPLTFRTIYYPTRPNNAGLSPKPYSLTFSTDPYNPLGSYLSLQVQKVATQMAILAHLAAISKGIERLGQLYLSLDYHKKVAAFQRELVNLARENLTYAENRLSIGTGTTLDVKMAQQELQLAQSELDQIGVAEKQRLTGLKHFLGLPPTAEFNPDFRDSRRQVLGSFNPANATAEQVKNHSSEIKVVELRKKLQGYKVFLAKANTMPNFLFTTQTPDPLSATSATGLYVGVGLEIPVWDGFKRFRDISRQKAILKQVDAEKAEKEDDVENLWQNAQEKIQANSLDLKTSQSKEELVRLKARQSEVSYQSGEVILSVALESRKKVLMAQKETLGKNVEYDLAVLKLRELSGDLGNTYVDPNSWQK